MEFYVKTVIRAEGFLIYTGTSYLHRIRNILYFVVYFAVGLYQNEKYFYKVYGI
jgi:hypothetical protein